MSFSSAVSGFNKKALVVTDRTRRAILLELFTRIILDTPVDTGRARGNWQTSIGSERDDTIERFDKKGSDVSEDALRAIDITGTQGSNGQAIPTIFFTNNLPYIESLENGSSKQSPVGMFKKNLIAIKQLVEEAARNNRI